MKYYVTVNVIVLAYLLMWFLIWWGTHLSTEGWIAFGQAVTILILLFADIAGVAYYLISYNDIWKAKP